MTDKQKKTIMMRTQGKTCCQGCGKVIHPETDDLKDQKRGPLVFPYCLCGKCLGEKDQLGKVKRGN